MRMLGVPSGSSGHCVNNHLYTPANTLVSNNGHRSCRACASDRRRKANLHHLDSIELPPAAWAKDSACRGADPRLFDSLSRREVVECDGRALGLDRVQVALSYCDMCPVRIQCREWAEELGEQGVWGGTYVSREGRHKKGTAA